MLITKLLYLNFEKGGLVIGNFVSFYDAKIVVSIKYLVRNYRLHKILPISFSIQKIAL